MPMNSLSIVELEAIDRYRRRYAWSSEYTYQRENSYAPIETVLYPWADAKSKHLYRLLGGNLILSKELSYVKSEDEIFEEMNSFIYKSKTFGRDKRSGNTFMKSYRYLLDVMNPYNFTDDEIMGLSDLIRIEYLSTNIYEGDDFSITLKDGKKYTVRNGCKVSRALGKIADSYGLDGWEDFRICHSQILNQRELTGTLNISIHPLDYMTMSDNECGWESCMNWQREGGYRQGTVEMMNSEWVVVAYLTSNSEMKLSETFSWNNKKWRELFIVHPDIITNVKSYPYRNDAISEEVMKWLLELAEKNLGWQYQPHVFHDFTEESKIFIEDFCEKKRKFYIDVDCGFMYDDYEGSDGNWIAFGESFCEDDIDVDYNCAIFRIPYSGPSQCMICGKLCIDDDFSNESCLACTDCQEIVTCDHCGDIIHPDKAYEVDGLTLCEDCYCKCCRECSICGEVHYESYMYCINVIPRLNEEQKKQVYDEYLNDVLVSPTAIDADKLIVIKTNRSNRSLAYLCDGCNDEDCIDKWSEKYLREGCRPHKRFIRYNEEVCVYFDELNKDALDIYFDDEDMTNDDYFKEIMACYHRVYKTDFIENL